MTISDPVRAGLMERVAVDAPVRGGSTPWRDELVSLLVLAEHGDEVSAGRLDRWLVSDTAARTMCTTMARDVALLRTHT